ncbi:AAA family ATPase [Epidermidibacterium keratini]|uniref:AAA family ATPase n=1 Tax=Epidermidibacterium keratini TaxID=1891644 RepID=A0A7L4YS16_9ACTN|nr:ATP-binding cassette domain-containing protein [Epidermidibacterium keratini]QHC01684.1 AAA family ATPase [Epidermidibacterium keratini]
MSSRPAILRVTDLAASYDGWPLFAGVNVQLPIGHLLVVEHDNDVVRTAFLECIAGVRRPDRGSVDADSVTAVWHADGLPENDAVADTISWQTDHDPSELLEEIGLEHRAEHEPWAMSAGERRRIALQIAFVADTDVLVLDEPERGLDLSWLAWVTERIDDVLAEGHVVVMATHNEQLAALADQTLRLAAD